MSGATDSGREIAAALRADWPMIASVSLCPRADGTGLAAVFHLDRIVVTGSLEQQGYPRTSAAAEKIEARRLAALEECVRRVNRGLPSSRQIRSFSIEG